MAQAEYYKRKIEQILGTPVKSRGQTQLRFQWDGIGEAKQRLAEVREMQQQLKLVKQHVNAEMKAIRANYTHRASSITPGLGSTLLLGKGKAKSLAAADKRRIHAVETQALQPYENVRRLIDEILAELDRIRARISLSIEQGRSTAGVDQHRESRQLRQGNAVGQKGLEKQEQAQYIASQKQLAADRTQEVQEALQALEGVLAHALTVAIEIDWEGFKDHSEYTISPPQRPALPLSPPREPQLSDRKYSVTIGVLDVISSSRKAAKRKDAEESFHKDHAEWQVAKEEYEKALEALEAEYQEALSAWEQERDAYVREQAESNAAIDALSEGYPRGDVEAVRFWCSNVLSSLEYPDCLPRAYDLDYSPENKVLIVDYQLPAITDLPTLREVTYVTSRDEFTEKHVSQTQLDRLYNGLLYQIALRTVHELYKADHASALDSLVFNGFVSTMDPATGHEIEPCILSVQANKEEFESIQLAHVDPKACFRSLKGIGSPRLQAMAPIPPILRIEREDARFIMAAAVLDEVQEGDNLAAMDWEDFEHLIRELFEKEFASSGGEVKVTRASRDGGVDAVAFDPDPIRGGKIVIQAKRYTGTVGVSAVRDLYGTVVNEGASKGIIVTTSHYGPDAYDFAKGKPLVLFDGNNLLHLLEKHGYRARINTQEAKKYASE